MMTIFTRTFSICVILLFVTPLYADSPKDWGRWDIKKSRFESTMSLFERVALAGVLSQSDLVNQILLDNPERNRLNNPDKQVTKIIKDIVFSEDPFQAIIDAADVVGYTAISNPDKTTEGGRFAALIGILSTGVDRGAPIADVDLEHYYDIGGEIIIANDQYRPTRSGSYIGYPTSPDQYSLRFPTSVELESGAVEGELMLRSLPDFLLIEVPGGSSLYNREAGINLVVAGGNLTPLSMMDALQGSNIVLNYKGYTDFEDQQVLITADLGNLTWTGSWSGSTGAAGGAGVSGFYAEGTINGATLQSTNLTADQVWMDNYTKYRPEFADAEVIGGSVDASFVGGNAEGVVGITTVETVGGTEFTETFGAVQKSVPYGL
jgi:hypothetical protein